MESRKLLRSIHIKNALNSWIDKKNGIYKWFEKERYSPEFCDEQIIYFTNLK